MRLSMACRRCANVKEKTKTCPGNCFRSATSEELSTFAFQFESLPSCWEEELMPRTAKMFVEVEQWHTKSSKRTWEKCPKNMSLNESQKSW